MKLSAVKLCRRGEEVKVNCRVAQRAIANLRNLPLSLLLPGGPLIGSPSGLTELCGAEMNTSSVGGEKAPE